MSFPICKKLQEQAPQVASPAAVSVRSYHILFVVRRRCPSVGTTLQGLGLTRLPDVKVLELNLEGGIDKMVPSILHQLRLVDLQGLGYIPGGFLGCLPSKLMKLT